MNTFAIVLTTLLSLCAGQSKDSCPATLPRDIYLQVKGNYCYYFELSRELTYPRAQSDCENEGGNLTTVNSQATNDYIVDQLQNYYSYVGSKDIWIGYTDFGHEGTFTWEDGSPSTFENWAPGEGQDTGIVHNREDCTGLNAGDGKWHDYSCSGSLLGILEDATHPYICQYAISS